MEVAVLIPTNNTRPHFLKEALTSIESQTVPPDEIIIEGRDGDWTDQNNMYEKLNKAISKMKSDIFIPLCDDDKLAPTYIERVKPFFPQYDIVGTFLENFGDQTGMHQPLYVPFVTAACTKAIWEKAGGYDEYAGMAADWDFWWLCKEAGAKILIINEPLFLYRVHATNVSKIGNWEASKAYVRKKHGDQAHP